MRKLTLSKRPWFFIRAVAFFMASSLFGQTVELQKFSFSKEAMGTRFNVILYSPDSVLAQTAFHAAFRRVHELNTCFSDYDPDSEVSQLSIKNSWHKVSDDLWKLLLFSKKINRKSRGAFDVATGALTQRWRAAFKAKVPPTTLEIDSLLSISGFLHVKMKRWKNQVQLTPGTRLDFGGVAKGYAVDEAMSVLRSFGITSALVDGGGDLLLGEAPPGKNGWAIQRNDVFENTMVEVIDTLSNCAIATSGDRYRFLEIEGKRYSHLLNPKTGYGLENQILVTVIAGSCREADALCTAFSVIPLEELVRWHQKFNFSRALLIQNEKGNYLKTQFEK